MNIKTRIWFGVLFAFLAGALFGSYEPPTETGKNILVVAGIVALYVIYLFAAHEKRNHD